MVKVLIPQFLQECIDFFPGVDRTIGGWEGLQAAQQCLLDESTKTNFAKVALNSEEEINYDSGYFAVHNTSEEMAEFLYKLYESDKVVGFVDHIKLELELKDPVFENLF